MLPVVGLRMPLRHFSSVLLPEPLWPRMPSVVPAWMVRSSGCRRDEVAVACAPEAQDALLDGVRGIFVEVEDLADVVGDDGVHAAHRISAKLPSALSKARRPMATSTMATTASSPRLRRYHH